MANNLLADHKIPYRLFLKRLKKYVWKERFAFIGALLLILLNVTCSVLLPRLTGFYSEYISGTPTLNNIIIIAVVVFGLSLLSQVFIFIESMILTKAGQRIVYELRMELFAHVESMSQNQFNDMSVGSLVTRVCSYTSQLSEFFTNTLVKVIRDLLTLVVIYVWMFVLSWKLGLILSIVVGVLFAISFVFSKKVHQIYAKERGQLSDINTYLNETLSGMKIVQLFNQQKRFEKKFYEKNHQYFKTRYSVTIAFSIYRPLVSLIYVLTIALIIYMGAKLSLSIGIITSFYLFLEYFFEPVQQLADQLNQITRANTGMERIFNLLDIKPEVINNEEAIYIKEFKGKIEFKHVYFAYEKDNWILKDVSFVINPKQTVAFVGATGSGKTTILSLIVRNYDIQKGQILIDDIDINKINVESLRKAIGQMLQDVFLFSGSIRNNITLFDDSYNDEEIMSAVNYVNAEDFISRLPKGIDDEIVEKGENFSVGQRQLLSFARTVLHKPQIMILDEATANIDTETETKIQDSLLKMKNIGTMLVVAHRLSTIQHADNIIVLSHGQIIESGSHQELLEKQGYYYNIYKLKYENQ